MTKLVSVDVQIIFLFKRIG